MGFLADFELLFHFVVDVICVGLTVYCYTIGSRSKWKSHTGWISWAIVGNVIVLLYRCIWNEYYTFGIHLSGEIYMFARYCLIVGDAIGIYSTVLLNRALRKMVDTPEEGVDPYAPGPPESPGVWPPAPVG